MSASDPIRTQIRLPAELHGRLVEAAENGGRSFNGEMVQRLEASFERPSQPRAERQVIEAIQDATRSFARSSLPQPEWAASDFASWPGQVSLSDFSLFFALLGMIDNRLAARFHEACLQHRWEAAAEEWQKVVHLFDHKHYDEAEQPKPKRAEPSARARRKHA